MNEEPGGPNALRTVVDASSLERITMVAWRDLDDPEAGGSELHAHRVAERWATAGLDVTLRTSQVPNAPPVVSRSGYRAVRRNGRYSVFPHMMADGLSRRTPKATGLVEVWNGMPFLSPLWFRGPRLIFLHHVHAEMWDMVLSPRQAWLGRNFERRIAPFFYKSSTIATPSNSSREEIIELLGIPADRVHVVPNGLDPFFVPGGNRKANPHVVAVGRLVPVKRFDVMIQVLVDAKKQLPNLTATIVGEGYERTTLEQLIQKHRAGSWLSLPGRISDEALLTEYQAAWVVASTSIREGWGMTLTEAAACGTPSIATDIAGHRDAVVRGVSGLLVNRDEEFSTRLVDLLTDQQALTTLSSGALKRSEELSWDKSALKIFSLLDGSASPSPT